MNKKTLLTFFISIIILVNIKTIFKFCYPIKYDVYVIKYASRYDMDPLLIFSIIKAESNFNPNAISSKGAMGLMQITPQTGEYISYLLKTSKFSNEELLNPETNIKFGIYYLSKLNKDFGGNLDTTLAAYNAGEGNVRKWLKEKQYILKSEELPFLETRIYIRKVKSYYTKYKWLYGQSY
ncbi:Soluble lytic murein transglycosylase precursor [Caloramator mitchellensis]|uniref:Soluble lytic murein transglycosylase n=1 Tax=Caloramator mitchellensis TaxID=908809 RepID=A0A0R3JX38_CALMK|nr:lytic transglycosylase domain-containing protein [Caloramator mitchellensis]KRQ88128.1 Soluble lytic murein transglycosylase precursor [Caloramator mitchellensis]